MLEEWLIFFGAIAGIIVAIALIIAFNDAREKRG